jgi:quercetin 2,3-dioxygenase
MKNRTVSQLLYAQMVDMGGISVRQPFPTQRVDQIDPFLLLHHADIKAPAHIEPDDAGVGPHPHRGFSPVTFIFKGGVHHRDSRGNDNVVYAGGAQWMNAGHEIGGRQEIIQLWINTPAAHKMDQPAYYPVTAEEASVIRSEDGKVSGNVFSGEVLGKKGPIPSHTEVNAATFEFKKGGKISIPFTASHNAMVYLLDGKLTVDGFGLVDALNVVLFNKDGEGISIEAIEDTRILFVTGEPLNEKVVSHGPFVMNNQTQILEAMRDYQLGKMGVLIEE